MSKEPGSPPATYYELSGHMLYVVWPDGRRSLLAWFSANGRNLWGWRTVRLTGRWVHKTKGAAIAALCRRLGIRRKDIR